VSNDEEPRIRDQGVISYVGVLVDSAVSFIGLLFFSNTLGPSGIGDFYSILSIISVVSFPAAGIGQAIQKRGSEHGDQPGRYLGAGLIIAVAYVALVSVVVGLVGTTGFGGFTTAQVVASLCVLTARVVFILVNDSYRAHGETGFAAVADNILGITETVIQTIFILIGFEVFGLLLGTAVATGSAVVIHLSVTEVWPQSPSRETFQSLVTFAQWTTATTGLNTIYDRLPVLVLTAFSSSTIVGYYTAANRLLVLGSHVGGSLAPTLMVRASGRKVDEAPKQQLRDLRVTLRFVSIIAVPMAFGATVLSEELVLILFGFSGGTALLTGLSVYHIVNTADTVTSAFVEGINRPEYAFRATIAAIGGRVIFIAITFPFLGAVGVVASVVSSHLLRVGVLHGLLRMEVGSISPPIGAGYQLVAGSIMTGIIIGLTIYLKIESILPLTIVVGVGAIIYVTALIAIDKQFRQIVVDIFQEIRLPL
jgi:O-antigen/teichoic acid export membrane protein